MGLSQIKVLGASLHGYQSQVNQELQNLKGQAARHVLLIIIIMIIILLLYISDSPDIYNITLVFLFVSTGLKKHVFVPYCRLGWVQLLGQCLSKGPDLDLKEPSTLLTDVFSTCTSLLLTPQR